jgi:hypothetical protein
MRLAAAFDTPWQWLRFRHVLFTVASPTIRAFEQLRTKTVFQVLHPAAKGRLPDVQRLSRPT